MKPVNLKPHLLKQDLNETIQPNNFRLEHTPTELQEDIVREFLHAKKRGTVNTDKGDYQTFITKQANDFTQQVITDLDKNNYTNWDNAVDGILADMFNSNTVEQGIVQLEKDINDTVESNNISIKQKTITTLDDLGRLLTNIKETAGEKSLWLLEQMTKSALQGTRVLGANMTLLGVFALLIVPPIIGYSRGLNTALSTAALFSLFTAIGGMMKISAERVAEQLGINLRAL